MSTTLGKSAGVALLLAAGLVLALYAAGVFSAQPASANGHALTTLRIDHDGGSLVLDPVFNGTTQTADVNNYIATFPRTATATEQSIRVVARANGSQSTTVTVAVDGTATLGTDSDAGQSHRVAQTITPDTADTQDLTGTLITVTAEVGGQSRIYRIRLKQDGVITDTKEAGAAVRLTVKAPVRARVGSDIILGLPSFGLPSSINTGDVTINDGDNLANPQSVSVSGSQITLTVGRLDPQKINSDPDNQLGTGTDGTEEVTITIASKAGIKNPTKAGTYLVTIDSSLSPTPNGVDARRVAEVERTIKVSPNSAGKGALVVVTGTGFSDGDVTIFMDIDKDNVYDAVGDMVLGTEEATNGSFTHETNDIDRNTNIQAIDLNGDVAAAGKAFTIKASIKVSPAEVSPAENLTVELVDWGSDRITAIRFGGSSGEIRTTTAATTPRAISADANGDKIVVQVPRDSRLGSLKVEALAGNRSIASAVVVVRTHELTISPPIAVPGQEITIQGSGFGNGQMIDSLTFGGGTSVYEGANAPPKPMSDSNGNITITVNVPGDVKPGMREIKATAENNRLGTASLEVPKPVLTVTPDMGLRGTPVTVRGEGFTANDSVQIQYDRYEGDAATPRTIITANVGSTGIFTATFEVPSFARIGKTQKITVNSQLNDDFTSVTVDHKTPKPTLTLSPERAAVGSTISISGANFAGFAPVADLKIDDRDVKPVPVPTTVRDGSITMTGILVPQLDAGSYTVRLDIAGEVVTTFIQVTDEPVSTAPADVFEPLGERLTVVWRYDNATGTWTSYSPTVPAALNDLAEVSTGTIVWVQVAEATTFQGKPLVAGWNLIVLN